MWRPGAAECQENDYNARNNGPMPRKNAGGHCPRPAHSSVSGLASRFPTGTELHWIALLEAPEAKDLQGVQKFFGFSI